MRIRHLRNRLPSRDESTMTAMIDIVFLLLVFFVMTFRVIAPEGDFAMNNTARAAVARSRVDTLQLPPITVRLSADQRGRLTAIRMNGRDLADFDELRHHVRELLRGAGISAGDEQSPAVEFDCDYGLNYEYVIDAVTAVSGYVDRGRVVELARKVRFSPARRPS